MKLLRIALLIASFVLQLVIGYSQSTFQILLKNSTNDNFGQIIEDNNNNYIIGGNSINNTGDHLVSSVIWRVSPSGDTLSKRYYLADTSLSFGYIEQLNTGNYKVLGYVWKGDGNFLLAIIEINPMLDIVNRKLVTLPEFRKANGMIVKKLNDYYYILSTNSDAEITYQYHPYLIKMNSDFDVVGTKYFPIAGNQDFEDFIFSPDSSQIWALGRGFYDIWIGWHAADQLVIYDTALSLKYVKQFPSAFYAHYQQARWISDSTFLHSCNYLVSGTNPQNDEICFTELDSTMYIYKQHFAGVPDTVDYGGYANTFDFRNPDSIYYCGVKNVIFEFWPHQPNWISTGMLNRNLHQSFQRFYGGDAYYHTCSILCTSDGGYIVGALRYDYQTQNNEHDIFILKLNAEGLITGTKDDKLCPYQPFAIYPNPGSGLLNLLLSIPTAEFSLLDMNGKQLVNRSINHGANKFDCNNLSSGTYIVKVSNPKYGVFTQKWIKK